MTAFLGIERSISGKLWLSREVDDRLALALAQRLNVPEIMGRVLAARDVGLDSAETFLSPTLKDHLPDPSHLLDMDKGVERIVAALTGSQKICVFGDYDVDGATSASLLLRFFNALGKPIELYVPDRLREGYGPNPQAMHSLKQRGVDLVICVDCGTTAFDALDAAKDIGLDVIVVDHHDGEPRLPAAIAVINPKRVDETSPHVHLAAVGVTFLLLVALNRTLRETNWYETNSVSPPNLMGLLDIVALGTVCDVVPLVGVNRALVVQGLKVMAKRGNAGLSALADVAGVNETPSAYHAGYVLGPRVNAGGRVGESSLGARLLSSDNPGESAEISKRLNELNGERQELEALVLEEAITQLEQSKPSSIAFAIGEDWHPGVVGIVASRLKDRYNMPACVVSLSDGKGHGSGRSVSGVDLGAMIIAARQSGLLIKGGGHAMAAGFTVEADKAEALRQFLEERIAAKVASENIVASIKFDGALSLAGANSELVKRLEDVAPFGAGNPSPRFVLSNVRIAKADVVGKDHVRCFLNSQDGSRLKAIAFRALDSDLGQALLNSAGRPLHLAGRLQLDTWAGRDDVQLLIDDAAWPV